MKLYFNEFERFAAAWLRDLWPEAHVDERSITDVSADDVHGFERVHLFGGIGGWEYALELAGWPAGRSVWTGSCPCQPFSAAGKRKGTADKRHLWPEMRRLIEFCRPATIFGEQVASKDGRDWLAGVCADLEALGYAVGAADLCAAGAGEEAEGRVRRGDSIRYERIVVGAPHIRQRLFWVAQSRSQSPRDNDPGEGPGACHAAPEGQAEAISESGRRCGPRGLADLQEDGRGQGGPHFRGGDQGIRAEGDGSGSTNGRSHVGMGESDSDGREPGELATATTRHGNSSVSTSRNGRLGDAERAGLSGESLGLLGAGREGYWSAFDLLTCIDEKTRRIEPGTFPLAHGVPNRVGRLRGYGNAIVPQVAAEFIGAFLDAEKTI